MSDEEPRGERIAKVMARAGVASRRDAEKMILAGRVAVNGTVVTSPALDVLPSDKVTLDGKPIDAPQPARLWLYYKPVGLVTSAKDEKGRQTVFDTMPEGMPRVMSVGRLDLTSEGLLLLTNDGELKRRLELPTTGWLRKYRVRVNGRPNEATFDPLRRGVTIDGETFLPMEITLDKQQGANAWLTVGLREGKNREIRRAMAEVGLTVNRLIRVSYGPFRLNTMKPGDVVEVKQKVLREQLGAPRGDGAGEDDRPARPRKPRRGGAAVKTQGDRKSLGKRPEGDARPAARGGKPFARKGGFAKRPARDDADAQDPAARSTGPRGKPRSAAAQADKPRRAAAKPGAGAERPRPHRARSEADGGKPEGGKRLGGKPGGRDGGRDGDAPHPDRARADARGAARKGAGAKPEGGARIGGKPGAAGRPAKDRPFGDRTTRGPRAGGDAATRSGGRPGAGAKRFGGKPGSGPKDRSARPGTDTGKPRGPRKGPGRKG